MTTHICDWSGKCERHERALHGYPCHACAEEHWRRFPRTRALIHTLADPAGRLVKPSEVTAARKRDLADRQAYDGPHTPEAVSAGEHGPVSRLWNAVCTEGCGWSHYWLPSKRAAETAAADHLTGVAA